MSVGPIAGGEEAFLQPPSIQVRLSLQETSALDVSISVSDKPAVPFEFSTRELIDFLKQISPNGKVPYSALKNYKPLNDREAQILGFLLEESIFDLIARLDREPQVLTVEDIKLAAGVAKDPLTLSAEDINLLKQSAPPLANKPPEVPLPLSSGKPPESGASAPFPFAPETLSRFLKQLNPDGVITYADLQRYQPKTSQEGAILAYLRQQSVFHYFSRLDRQIGILRPSDIQLAASVAANRFIVQKQQLSPSAFEAFKPSLGIEKIAPPQLGAGGGSPPLYQTRKPKHIHFSTQEMTAFLKRLHPSGEVSLAQLKHYHPQTPREAEIVDCLVEESIFYLLSRLDPHPGMLNPADIRRAASLAGDPSTLDDADLEYLRQHPFMVLPVAAIGEDPEEEEQKEEEPNPE